LHEVIRERHDRLFIYLDIARWWHIRLAKDPEGLLMSGEQCQQPLLVRGVSLFEDTKRLVAWTLDVLAIVKELLLARWEGAGCESDVLELRAVELLKDHIGDVVLSDNRRTKLRKEVTIPYCSIV
jgi:hypothetical protein